MGDAIRVIEILKAETNVTDECLNLIDLYVGDAVRNMVNFSGVPSLDMLAENTAKISDWFIGIYTTIANPEVRERFKSVFLKNIDIGKLPYGPVNLVPPSTKKNNEAANQAS